MSTGFNVHVSSSLAQKLLPVILAAGVGLVTGGGGTSFLEVTGASAYKQSVEDKIAQNEALEEEVTALRAQNDQLIKLIVPSLCLGEN